jgi:outer membrane receptor protein involved in Fe transport
VYQKEFGTLNFSINQRLTRHLTLRFQAKNLTNPTIEEVYRSDFTGDDLTNTSFTRGVEYALSISASYSL